MLRYSELDGSDLGGVMKEIVSNSEAMGNRGEIVAGRDAYQVPVLTYRDKDDGDSDDGGDGFDDGFDPFDPRLKTTEYKINYLTKDIAVGYRIKYAEGTYTKGINRNLNVTVDLNKHKLYFWTKKKPKEFYSKISCKLYKGTNSGSFLHKILKMLN